MEPIALQDIFRGVGYCNTAIQEAKVKVCKPPMGKLLQGGLVGLAVCRLPLTPRRTPDDMNRSAEFKGVRQLREPCIAIIWVAAVAMARCPWCRGLKEPGITTGTTSGSRSGTYEPGERQFSK